MVYSLYMFWSWVFCYVFFSLFCCFCCYFCLFVCLCFGEIDTNITTGNQEKGGGGGGEQYLFINIFVTIFCTKKLN